MAGKRMRNKNQEEDYDDIPDSVKKMSKKSKKKKKKTYIFKDSINTTCDNSNFSRSTNWICI